LPPPFCLVQKQFLGICILKKVWRTLLSPFVPSGGSPVMVVDKPSELSKSVRGSLFLISKADPSLKIKTDDDDDD
jgi:hypothetical protein